MDEVIANIAATFWGLVSKDQDCWNWLGKTNNGYGQIMILYRSYRAHRVAWMLTNGPIPDGLTLDHLCRNRRCVNPAHLEPVTSGENSRRATLGRSVCKHGHAFTPENTGRCSRGNRLCIACERARWRKPGTIRRAKVTEEIAAGIREMRTTGASTKAIGARYGLNASTVQRVLGGRRTRAKESPRV